jgi:LytS/YehU family sensor histidine kinase
MGAAELSRRGAALEAELAHAKLDALRSQLRPHFLFNTLNAIAVLSQQDSAKTRQMLLRLSSLLRRSLDEDTHEVALSRELSFLNEYLDIMRVRLGDRLDARVCAEANALDARVPVFLLQPLIENALEYGEGDDGQIRIVVAAERADADLVLVVENSAASEFRSDAMRDGIGLGNTRARLRALYGDRAYVRLGPATQFFALAGVRVELGLPFASATAVNA